MVAGIARWLALSGGWHWLWSLSVRIVWRLALSGGWHCLVVVTVALLGLLNGRHCLMAGAAWWLALNDGLVARAASWMALP